MLIFMIWLGSILPIKYYPNIYNCNDHLQNTCLILSQPHQASLLAKYNSMLGISEERIKKMTLPERVDLLKLLYLYQKGGVYLDIQNQVDYLCLHEILNTQQTSFFGQQEKQPHNYFIYAPKPKDPKLQGVIKRISECPSCSGSNFAGLDFLKRIGVDSTDVSKCVIAGSQVSSSEEKGIQIIPIANDQQYNQCLSDLNNCKSSLKKCPPSGQSNSQCDQERNEGKKKIETCKEKSRPIISSLSQYRGSFDKCTKSLRKSRGIADLDPHDFGKQYPAACARLTANKISVLIGYFFIGYIVAYLAKKFKKKIEKPQKQVTVTEDRLNNGRLETAE